ncbi:MAG TPA: class I SAM-dependent methyltransferase [Polyangiaceae bacterium]|jgi:SAM-dependent methyltransferase
MSVFGSYSRYYDLLYKDKEYAREVEYIHELIQRDHPRAKSILDLGCGTGKHAFLLAERGYRVAGVDLSEQMLSEARARLAGANAEQAARWAASGAAPEFRQGDVRSVRIGTRFDVVVSLFHVMSYQTANADLKAALATAREHLAPNGLFIFDCWYGPAVLTERPEVRIRRLEDEHISVTRLAEPVLHPTQNLVDVNYHVFVKDKQSGALDELRETHTMRYLFSPEVELLLEAAGLRLTRSEEFMSSAKLGFKSWSAVFVASSTE